MGYRPTIICGTKEIGLSKFYGYVDLDGLKSIDWLIDNNKISQDENIIFNIYPSGPEIVFTADEFREFIDLYQDDINNYDFRENSFSYPKDYRIADYYLDFDEIYKNNKPKTIEWG